MESLGRKVTLIPVFIAQGVDTHVLAGSGRVNEFIIPDIDTCMFQALATVVFEEHHITGLQVRTINVFRR